MDVHSALAATLGPNHMQGLTSPHMCTVQDTSISIHTYDPCALPQGQYAAKLQDTAKYNFTSFQDS